MARQLKPRSASNYDNRVHGRRESSAPPDDKTINQSLTRVNLVRPKWNGGPLVFRCFPALDPFSSTPKPLPGRLGIDPREINPFMVRVPVASFAGLEAEGNEKATFILYEPWKADEKKAHNPYRLFYFACKDAFKAGEFGNGHAWNSKWNRFMNGGKNRGPEISPPKAVWYAQGYILANDEKDYVASRDAPLGLGDDDETVLVQLSVSAGDGLLDLLATQRPSEKIPNNVNPDTHPWRFLSYGDPTGVPVEGGVNKGVICTIFNPNKVKTITKNTTWDGTIKETGQGYEAAVYREWTASNNQVVSADLTPEAYQKALNSWQFWFDDDETGQKGILKCPSVEEQCLLMAKGFQTCPELLEFAWADHSEFFTDDVQGVLRQRRSAVVPGQAPGQPKVKTDPILAARSDDFQDDEDETTEEAPAASKPAASSKAAPAAAVAAAADDDDDSFGDDDVVDEAQTPIEGEASMDADDDAFGDDPDDFDEEEDMESDVPAAAPAPAAAEQTDADDFNEDDFEEAPAEAAPAAEAEMSAAMAAAQANSGQRKSKPPKA